MLRKSVLVVEDDADILELLTRNLRSAGFKVHGAMEGQGGIAAAKAHAPDLILLDLMLPDMDGLDVFRKLKEDPRTRNIAVIMLTARGGESERILGLELGADDYVVKPFSPRELILRVRAVLRRPGWEIESESVCHYEGLRVDLGSHRVTVDGNEIVLTLTEFRLLAEMIRNSGKVLRRDQLLERVWVYQCEGYARTVDTHMRRLRQKLGPYSSQIETIRGVGYRFRT